MMVQHQAQPVPGPAAITAELIIGFIDKKQKEQHYARG